MTHTVLMIVVGVAMALAGSDLVAPKVNYRKLRDSTGSILLLMIAFLVSFSLAVSAPGVFGVLGAGAAALIFGICWSGTSKKS